jgi:MFS family permease
MQQVYEMDETELGILGSIVYLGISLMGLFAGRLYQHFNSKLLTVIALIMLEFSLLLFVLSRHKVTAYLSRFATGVCQVFLLVYYPIWIDKFGGANKTLWLTLLQICVPVGIFMGYGMTAVIISSGTEYYLSFYIQIGMVACFILAFVFLSKKKLDSRRRLSEELIDTLIEGRPVSILTDAQETESEKGRKYEFKFMMRKLLKSKMYLVGTFTMAVILYVSTGIQFWLTKYFVDVLHFDESTVFLAYAIVSITGPTTGCAFGINFAIQEDMLLIESADMIILTRSITSLCSQLLELDQQLLFPSLTSFTGYALSYGLFYFLVGP